MDTGPEIRLIRPTREGASGAGAAEGSGCACATLPTMRAKSRNAATRARPRRSGRTKEYLISFGILWPRGVRCPAIAGVGLPPLNAGARRTCTFETLGCSRSAGQREGRLYACANAAAYAPVEQYANARLPYTLEREWMNNLGSD